MIHSGHPLKRGVDNRERYEKHYRRSNENCIKSRQERPVGEAATRPVLTAGGGRGVVILAGCGGESEPIHWMQIAVDLLRGARTTENCLGNFFFFFTVNERQIKQQAENESCVLT